MEAFKITFLLMFLSVALIRTGRMLGGEEVAWVAFIFALATHGISYWFGDKIILWIYGAKEIEGNKAPRLYRIVQELTFRDQMPMPRFYLLPQRSPIAFATSRNEKHTAVAIQQDIHGLDEAKLRSVLAQHLSQIKHLDRIAENVTTSVIE